MTPIDLQCELVKGIIARCRHKSGLSPKLNQLRDKHACSSQKTVPSNVCVQVSIKVELVHLAVGTLLAFLLLKPRDITSGWQRVPAYMPHMQRLNLTLSYASVTDTTAYYYHPISR